MGSKDRTRKGRGKGYTLVDPLVKLRVIKHADGRMGLPDIFQYRLEDGTLLDVPPIVKSHPAGIKGRQVSVPYALIIYDREKYRGLEQSGWVYSPEHRGSHTMFDQRTTS